MNPSEIKEHMEVVGTDGKHHFLSLSAVMSIGEFVTLSLTAQEAEAQWQAE